MWRLCGVLCLLPVCVKAQLLIPESAHVNLYFPHLVDGGPPAQQWQTKLSFYNPNKYSASVIVYFHADSGQPLALNFGSGSAPTLSFSLPPFGSRVFRSTIASSVARTGWAFGDATLPIQGNVTFRAIQDGIPSVELSATPTLPTTQFNAVASRDLGIALANRWVNASITVSVAVQNADGRIVQEKDVSLPPAGHTAFTLGQIFPSLPNPFNGSVHITSLSNIQNSFVAWAVNSESGTIFSLPDGRSLYPLAHWDRIWYVYSALLAEVKDIHKDLDFSDVRLSISETRSVNASASSNGVVTISIALSELLSDSLSELAAVVGHELAHIVQYKTTFPIGSAEIDADQRGMLYSMFAGFDPYAAGGALGKMMMATKRTGILAQSFDNLTDHTSFPNRMEKIMDLIEALCADSRYRSYCASRKTLYHPHLPDGLPLSIQEERHGHPKRTIQER